MVDHVRLVDAKHMLELLLAEQLVGRLESGRVELDVERLTVPRHQTQRYHQK